MSAKLRLFLLVAIGGALTLGSYVWGFTQYPELAQDFWGDVPENWIPYYTNNMFLAATGFLAAFALFMTRASDTQISQLYLPYALILIPSALWLPSTVLMLQQPSNWLWWLIRIDLFAVGLGGLMLYPAMAKTNVGNTFRWAAYISFAFFVLQTAFLDAIIWPAYFPTP